MPDEKLDSNDSADAKKNAFAVPTPKIEIKVIADHGIHVSGHPPLGKGDQAFVEAPVAMNLIAQGAVEPV